MINIFTDLHIYQISKCLLNTQNTYLCRETLIILIINLIL